MSNVIDYMAVKAAREGQRQLVWECRCGSQKYLLTEEGPQCFDCGIWWDWETLLRRMEIKINTTTGTL